MNYFTFLAIRALFGFAKLALSLFLGAFARTAEVFLRRDFGPRYLAPLGPLTFVLLFCWVLGFGVLLSLPVSFWHATKAALLSPEARAQLAFDTALMDARLRDPETRDGQVDEVFESTVESLRSAGDKAYRMYQEEKERLSTLPPIIHDESKEPTESRVYVLDEAVSFSQRLGREILLRATDTVSGPLFLFASAFLVVGLVQLFTAPKDATGHLQRSGDRGSSRYSGTPILQSLLPRLDESTIKLYVEPAIVLVLAIYFWGRLPGSSIILPSLNIDASLGHYLLLTACSLCSKEAFERASLWSQTLNIHDESHKAQELTGALGNLHGQLTTGSLSTSPTGAFTNTHQQPIISLAPVASDFSAKLLGAYAALDSPVLQTLTQRPQPKGCQTPVSAK